jgi:hypothetical protein
MYSLRFKRIGDIDHLQQSILRTKEALAATTHDHPERASLLNNLGNRHILRYTHPQTSDDREKAIQAFREAIGLQSATPSSRIIAAL